MKAPLFDKGLASEEPPFQYQSYDTTWQKIDNGVTRLATCMGSTHVAGRELATHDAIGVSTNSGSKFSIYLCSSTSDIQQLQLFGCALATAFSASSSSAVSQSV